MIAVLKRVARFAHKWVPVIWRATTRAVGLAGLIYLGVERENPDPLLIIACLTMLGLPTAIDLDKERGGK